MAGCQGWQPRSPSRVTPEAHLPNVVFSKPAASRKLFRPHTASQTPELSSPKASRPPAFEVASPANPVPLPTFSPFGSTPPSQSSNKLKTIKKLQVGISVEGKAYEAGFAPPLASWPGGWVPGNELTFPSPSSREAGRQAVCARSWSLWKS